MKKYKILKLYVLGIAVFMFYGLFNVYAANLPEACAGDLNDACYAEVFGVDVELDAKNDSAKVYVGKNYKDEDGNAAVFKILKVNGKDYSSKNWRVRYNHPKTINVEIDNNQMIIEMRTTKNIKVKSGNETKTGKVSVTLTVKQTQRGQADRTAGEDPGDLPDFTVPQKEIDCSYIDTGAQYYSLTNFKDRFCYTKQKAIKAGGKHNQGKVSDSVDEVLTSKCSVDAKKITAEYNDDDDSLGGYNDQYYQNRRYFYAYSITSYNDLGQYKYNYYPGENYPGETLTCKLECQEAVIVEYGPPVASKAGLCFDYKVKVTSRVHCWIKQKPPKPEKPKGYCTPGPTCYGSGGTYRQGGPSDEYDKCIQECDGGKYSTKCSNSCYKEVYGKSVTTSSSVKNTVSSAVSSCASSSSYDGCYYRTSKNGSIHWYGQGGHDIYAPGRWYVNHPNSWGISGHSYYVPLNDGFYRAHHADGGYCHDSCHWSGCSWDEYLNPGQDKIDYEANKKIYEEALAKCQEKAKCNTTTTEFQIAASYNRDKDENGNTENVVIHFPYSNTNDMVVGGKVDDDINTPDKLTVCEHKSGDTNGNANSTIRRFDGCYGESCPKDQIRYMTEWTFPGSWVNKKTGEISYSPDSKDKAGWRSHERKFCIPRDANSVNALWYQWYFHKVENTETSTYDGICLSSQTRDVISHDKYSEYKGDPNTYNIYAKAKKFGYFKWNFDIKCFYALDNGDNKEDHTTEINENNKDKCQTNYRIRTVANTELFPSGEVTSTESSQTRTKGYNWTNEASLKNQKDIPASYKVDPAEVQATIQTNGDKIYVGKDSTNQYIDYQFKLTPNDLNKIKDYNSKVGAFGKFCGKIEQVPSSGAKELTMSVYYSNVIRGGNGDGSCGATIELSSIKLGQPGVNNQ